MLIGIPKESNVNESRVAMTPLVAKKLIKKGLKIKIEAGAGIKAGYPDESYTKEGVALSSRDESLQAEIVLKVLKPSDQEISLMNKGALLISLIDPHDGSETLNQLSSKAINAVSLELVPRTSRAQSMDVLSSQANIAGYRVVLEAARLYPRFFPMMMTSAGMAKPAKVLVVGAGVAGLQAIATARRLGAQVEAFDVRSEVKEQIQSLGAKFLELNLNEEGAGQGGYAKELSEESKKKQVEALGVAAGRFDILILTANIPGRKAPLLITKSAVGGMRAGSVIIDMAAASGGNCELTQKDSIVNTGGVQIVGFTNYPSLVPGDASHFFATNCINLLELFLKKEADSISLHYNLEDDIVAASLVTLDNKLRFQRKN